MQTNWRYLSPILFDIFYIIILHQSQLSKQDKQLNIVKILLKIATCVKRNFPSLKDNHSFNLFKDFISIIVSITWFSYFLYLFLRLRMRTADSFSRQSIFSKSLRLFANTTSVLSKLLQAATTAMKAACSGSFGWRLLRLNLNSGR